MPHFQCLSCSETTFINIYNHQSSSNVIERSPLSTLWSPKEMEPLLLMFIESPIIQTDTLIMTITIRPAQQQLFHTAVNLSSCTPGKKREHSQIHAALESNSYPSKFIQNIQTTQTQSSTNVSPDELVGMFFKMVETTESCKSFATLPYIKGVTEPLTRVLKKHDIAVVNKPLVTLQQQFLAPRFQPLLESQTNVVY